ncbi:hypothetical protein BCR41DRAFT_165392 [Lobosporangium transversale]|uniref:Secreted protein n=1 Tax=Lobosporangium transversale TaxID=64571 RepID=A0A1Y2GC71_9FUNG|nr:hypothetical protein BCR41DRAFT_165392 [Lobosporangium transversale]ORZ06764.1 hypothetical protein BCR41DRAFT_165392 [Lobosporangium transversale]|eukprot:XP_021877685.1 hypothetical protein BCR41DRAFT_165392 [Lobosporangium transversale]
MNCLSVIVLLGCAGCGAVIRSRGGPRCVSMGLFFFLSRKICSFNIFPSTRRKKKEKGFCFKLIEIDTDYVFFLHLILLSDLSPVSKRRVSF